MSNDIAEEIMCRLNQAQIDTPLKDNRHNVDESCVKAMVACYRHISTPQQVTNDKTIVVRFKGINL